MIKRSADFRLRGRGLLCVASTSALLYGLCMHYGQFAAYPGTPTIGLSSSSLKMVAPQYKPVLFLIWCGTYIMAINHDIDLHPLQRNQLQGMNLEIVDSGCCHPDHILDQTRASSEVLWPTPPYSHAWPHAAPTSPYQCLVSPCGKVVTRFSC